MISPARKSHSGESRATPRVLQKVNPALRSIDERQAPQTFRGQMSSTSLPPMLPPIPRVASQSDLTIPRPQPSRVQTDGAILSTSTSDSLLVRPGYGQSPTITSASESPDSLTDEREWTKISAPRPTGRAVSYSAPSLGQPRKVSTPKDLRSVSLAVPYDTTTASATPELGGRPLQATSTINGIPKHARTSTPMVDTNQQKSSNKRGLNLLKPVSLLMRRRSAQPPIDVEEDNNATRKLTVPPMTLPDDYDPRIRGKVVHDFSVPRAQRSTSQNDIRLGSSPTIPSLSLPSDFWQPVDESGPRPASDGGHGTRRSSQHTALFVEHLDESVPDDRRQSAVHAETLANNEFLSRVSWQSQKTCDSVVLPPFARKSQQIDPRQAQIISENGFRTSHPSSISSRSEVSALSGLPGPTSSTDESVSPVSPATTMQERYPQPVSDFDVAATVGQSTPKQQSPPQLPPRFPEIALSGNAGLPRHFKSNASRFSFQMAGQDSITEEKLLEEKHKVKATDSLGDGEQVYDEDDDDEDFFDEDAMYDHDELEGMKGVGEVSPTSQPGMHYGFDQGIAPMSVESTVGASEYQVEHAPHVIVTSPPVAKIPADNNTRGLDADSGANERATHGSTQDEEGSNAVQSSQSSDYGDDSIRRQLPSKSSGDDMGSLKAAVGTHAKSPSRSLDNDFYFHDGMIDDIDGALGPSIREDDFDDPTFLAKPRMPQQDFTLSPYDNADESDAYDVDGYTFLMQHRSQDAETVEEPILTTQKSQLQDESEDSPTSKAVAHSPSLLEQTPSGGDELAAYYGALADAANKAAADGRFTRQGSDATSISQYSHYSMHKDSHEESQAISNPALAAWRTPQPKTFVHNVARDSYSGFDFGFDEPAASSTTSPQSSSFPINAFSPPEDNFDDEYFGDDAIISEANADALASDDEGFYGQEFGFYAKARGDGDNAEAINGGFFGPAGVDMIERKWSLKEPNLTPITERSEFSTRNSFIGGPFSPGAAGAGAGNPAFAAQLARMSPLAWAHMQEEGMSLEQLLRARNQAFGPGSESSQQSQRSSVSGQGSGQLQTVNAQIGPWAAAVGPHFMPKGGSPMVFQYSTDSSHSSNFATKSQLDLRRDSQTHPYGEGSGHAHSPVVESPLGASNPQGFNPTYAARHDPDTTPKKATNEAQLQSQSQSPNDSTPRQTQGHSRTQSGADSVTYVREQNPGEPERWVLERRRASAGGLLELVGREVVEGGRI